MREIKFRAWDKSKEIMSEIFDLDDLIYGYDNGCKINDKKLYVGSLPKWENIILMQYTGLKDKDGKEIYEGDIVKYIFQCDTPWASNSQGIIEWKATGFYLNCFKGKGRVQGWLIAVPHDEGRLFEVLGNIHEDPEFLEQK